MKRDGDNPKRRRGDHSVAFAAGMAASILLWACVACNGFFVDPTLSSIQINPAGATVLVGATQQYKAVATYNDGSTKNLSPVWTSSPAATATITSAGLAKGVATGTATVTATSGGITGTTTLLVQRAAQSIAVTPANPSISVQAAVQFTATATFADGTSQDVTGSASWTSSVATVATITTGGLASGVAAGSTQVQATFGGVSGITTLTVK